MAGILFERARGTAPALQLYDKLEPGSLSGLTLFEGSKGWQLSYRHRGDDGWVVKQVPSSEARKILDMLAGVAPDEGLLVEYMKPKLVSPSQRRERLEEPAPRQREKL